MVFLSLRYQIAILRRNENVGRVQAKTREGEDRYNVVYPKFKKGSHTLCKVFEQATFSKLECRTLFSLNKVLHQ